MSDQPQAGPTLLQTWITCINQGNFDYLEGAFVKAWGSYKMLFYWLPELCKDDCKPLLDEIEEEYVRLSSSKGTSFQTAQKRMTQQINTYLYKSIPIFAMLVEHSLEDRKWIHREENRAKPRSLLSPHIGEDKP